MKRPFLNLAICTAALLCLNLLPSCTQKAVKVTGLTVNSRADEIWTDSPAPALSWKIESHKPGTLQTAYQILVAASPDGFDNALVWDSGKVESGNSVLIPYAGLDLASRGTYYWKVKVWTSEGENPWSETRRWNMALTEPGDWQAQWIGIDSTLNSGEFQPDTRLSARYLRKEFEAAKKITRATLYISGLGMYECYINGKKVSEEIFAPTATDYLKRVNYNVYDVKSLIDPGKPNTLGVILGNGRFFSMRMDNLPGKARTRVPNIIHYGFPKLLCQLEIELSDGTRQKVVSDASWKLTAEGPIVANNEFDGEEYDARLEMPGWDKNGFDDSTWRGAMVVEAPAGKLVAQANPNLYTMRTLKPVSVTELEKGTYIVDMGQNMVGWESVKLKGKAGIPVKMRFAETLKQDGSLYMDNIRGAHVTDIYTPARDGQFSYSPRFVYHGFRFMEITGIDYAPAKEDITGMVNYDRMEDTGTFECSDKTLNEVYRNAMWGIMGNYRSMPTDCPQRDERMGWLGDRAMGCIGESYALDCHLLYNKWAQDIEDAQQPDGRIPDVAPNFWHVYSDDVTWPAAFPAVLQMLYEQFGDPSAIKLHYASIKEWMAYIETQYQKDGIITRDTYGDWCMPPEKQEYIHSKDPARITDGALLSTSFFYRIYNMMARFAPIAGQGGDAAMFLEKAAAMKEAYNAKFFNAETASYSNNTVTANLVSLMQGLVPEGYEQKVFDNLAYRIENDFDSHVSVGLIGIQFLMRGLTEWGRADLALKIATQRTYPSWGYMIDHGATTTWELWNGNTADPGMNSHNHVMLLGDVVAWMYEDLGGIKTDKAEVGFKKIVMKPAFPEGLTYAKASHRSPYGLITSDWKREDGQLLWHIEVPANSSAEVTFPVASLDRIQCNGLPLEQTGTITAEVNANETVVATLLSGTYDFAVRF